MSRDALLFWSALFVVVCLTGAHLLARCSQAEGWDEE